LLKCSNVAGANANEEADTIKRLEIKILSYNVAGIRNRLMYNDLFQYIASFQIFIPSETFLEAKLDAVEVKFKDFVLRWVPAIRTSARGRASGGMLFGIKKELHDRNIIRFINVDETTIIQLRTVENENLHLLPVYINCNHWERDSGKLYEGLNHPRLNESALIIGDCNARLGEAQLHGFDQQLVTSSLNEVRNAKDKVTDANGRHLMDLIELFGFTGVNGRSSSDFLGDYTFMRGEARSTIDQCMARGTSIETIKDFQVSSQIIANHLPLQLTVILSTISNAITAPLGHLPSLISRNREN